MLFIQEKHSMENGPCIGSGLKCKDTSLLCDIREHLAELSCVTTYINNDAIIGNIALKNRFQFTVMLFKDGFKKMGKETWSQREMVKR